MKTHLSRERSAFTLVELLVVIGIITLLISILLPTISKAREQANRTVCLSNVRQLAVAAIMYANEYKGVFPVESAEKSLIFNQLYLSPDLMRADMYMLMKFGKKNVTPTTNLPDRIWQCPSNESRWAVTTTTGTYYGTNGTTNATNIRSSYMYLGAGYSLVNNSYELDATRRNHRLGERGFANPLFADEVSSTNQATILGFPIPIALPNLAGLRINHATKNSTTSVAGSNESFTDGHAEWVRTFPKKLIPGSPNTGNANLCHTNLVTAILSVESYWW